MKKPRYGRNKMRRLAQARKAQMAAIDQRPEAKLIARAQGRVVIKHQLA